MAGLPAAASIGQRYGKLVVAEIVGYVRPSTVVLCLCDCGNKRQHSLAHLRKGRVRSCGCIVGMRHDISSVERLLESACPEPNTGCWLWEGTRNNRGYGFLRRRYAHRVVWELANGPIPRKMSVCHRCDTPCCINPTHLFLGTHEDNMRDMAAKHRSGMKKLSVASVVKIRRAYLVDNVTLGELARSHGVDKKTLRDAIAGRTWSHVPFEK